MLNITGLAGDRNLELDRSLRGCVSVKFDIPFGTHGEAKGPSKIAQFYGKVVPLSAVLSLGFPPYPWINEIRLFASQKVVIDADIKANGRMMEIIIAAPHVEVVGKRIMDLKGKDGRENASPKASPGGNGLPGEHGGHGGHFQIFCEKLQNASNLTVNCEGGKGSDGQDGGDGKNGENGKDGTPADCFGEGYCNSYPGIQKCFGFPGTEGQNGGDGGFRGFGGPSGTVNVFIEEVDEDNQIHAIIGDGITGKDGVGGKRGIGGTYGATYTRRDYNHDDYQIMRFLSPLFLDGRQQSHRKAEDGAPGETGKCGRMAGRNREPTYSAATPVEKIVSGYGKFISELTTSKDSKQHSTATEFLKKLEMQQYQMKDFCA